MRSKKLEASRFLTVAIAAALLSGCAICQRKNAPDPAAPLAASPVVRFSDIPVPAGFQLISGQSYAYENAGVRVAMLKYKGKASADKVLAFYRSQMLQHSWALLNVVEYGERQLNFSRASETCVVTVSPTFTATLVYVTLGPRPPAAKAPLEKTLDK